MCYTQIYLQNGVIFSCQDPNLASHVLNVQNNESVDLRAEYKSPNARGTFYHCIGFQQRGKYAYIFKVTQLQNT